MATVAVSISNIKDHREAVTRRHLIREILIASNGESRACK
jgi:hypothetical protein